ncbi:MAG: N-acetylmuramoyl-L-alanine amidase [Bacteroidaceae bacterium]|nr:N-acetylmuramoyl-L-alanine amidase [Bacteroidaceae bacterium]
MRIITLLIIHCSAVMPFQTSSVEQINEWHLAKGWANGCGYHYVVRRSGEIEVGRPEEMVGAHCLNHNRHSLGICYEGGLDENGKAADTRTPEQKEAMLYLLKELKKKYPKAIIVSHSIFSNKSCPCFDAAKEYQDLQP